MTAQRTATTIAVSALLSLSGAGDLLADVIHTAGFEGHTYHLLDTDGTKWWFEAEAEAVSLGGHLVTINSAAEDQFVFDAFAQVANEYAFANNLPQRDKISLWIGLNDADLEGTWVWSGGEPVLYTNWQTGQPQGSMSDEDFGGILVNFGEPGRWHDLYGHTCCDLPFGIVEIPGPPNDLCANAIPITEGDTTFSNVNATTDGPALPLACAEFGELGFAADIWFTYTPEQSGTVTISTCNQVDYDSRLAAYGGSCENLLIGACNDDAPGCGQSSMITIPSIAAGETAIIRVGSFQFPTGQFSTGSGMLTITLEPCPDFNGDADVGFADLTILLAWWGECSTEPCFSTYDLDGDGAVGFADLTTLLAKWGPC